MRVAATIKPPTLPLCHPDRQLECTQALEAEDFQLLDRGSRAVRNEEFQALALRAEAAGWMPSEIAAAMISLGEKYVAIKANPKPSASPGDSRGEDTDF